MLLNVTVTKIINGTSTNINSVYETRNNWLDVPKDIMGQTLLTDGSPTALSYAGNNILVGAAGKIYLSPDDGNTWKQVWTNDARIISICSDPSNQNEIFFATDFIRRPGAIFHVTIGADAQAIWNNVVPLTGNIIGEVSNLYCLPMGREKHPIYT